MQVRERRLAESAETELDEHLLHLSFEASEVLVLAEVGVESVGDEPGLVVLDYYALVRVVPDEHDASLLGVGVPDVDPKPLIQVAFFSFEVFCAVPVVGVHLGGGCVDKPARPTDERCRSSVADVIDVAVVLVCRESEEGHPVFVDFFGLEPAVDCVLFSTTGCFDYVGLALAVRFAARERDGGVDQVYSGEFGSGLRQLVIADAVVLNCVSRAEE